MLQVWDPLASDTLAPDINAGGCEDRNGPARVTVVGSDVAAVPVPEYDPIIREIRLSVFRSITNVIGQLENRITALEAAVEALAARLQELSVSR